MVSMSRGAIVNMSRKHKLNVGSSTESELVSIANVLGVVIWCKYFMEVQGYTIDNNLLYQDNKSTILLAKNGRISAGKASRHIHHRYFLVTDKIEKGDVTAEHRRTKEMWADGNTKPLQGQGSGHSVPRLWVSLRTMTTTPNKIGPTQCCYPSQRMLGWSQTRTLRSWQRL